MDKNITPYRDALHSSVMTLSSTAHMVTEGIIGSLNEPSGSKWISANIKSERVYINLGATVIDPDYDAWQS